MRAKCVSGCWSFETATRTPSWTGRVFSGFSAKPTTPMLSIS